MPEPVELLVEPLPHGAGLPLPAYATAGAAGADLLAALPAAEAVELAPGRRTLIPTGIRIAVPEGYEAQVRPRSGLAAEHGVTVLNSPGTIDSDYRGEIKVILVNHGDVSFRIARGQRIAQLVVAPVARVAWTPGDVAGRATARGAGGFGSTGTVATEDESERC